MLPVPSFDPVLELELASLLVELAPAWVEVVSPPGPSELELELEPDGVPPESSPHPKERENRSAAAPDCKLGRICMLQGLCQLHAPNSNPQMGR